MDMVVGQVELSRALTGLLEIGISNWPYLKLNIGYLVKWIIDVSIPALFCCYSVIKVFCFNLIWVLVLLFIYWYVYIIRQMFIANIANPHLWCIVLLCLFYRFADKTADNCDYFMHTYCITWGGYVSAAIVEIIYWHNLS